MVHIMLISVVIPVYNTIEYLPDCIQSIENQRFDDLEIVLVDDGSTDGSSSYCDNYQKAHSNVKVIHKKNGGASDSRNVGLLAASGEYVHFIDSDDILLGYCVYNEFLNSIYPSKPEIVLARFEEYSPDFITLEKTQRTYITEGLFEGDVLKEVLNHKYPATLTSPVNKLFSRQFLLNNNLFFKTGIDHEEDEWLPRVIVCSQRIWFSNQIIYGVRKGRPGSLSETLSEQVRARKACSKIMIASEGMKYMEGKCLPSKTMSLISEYYWDYFVDSCVAYSMITAKSLKNNIYTEIKNNKEFFYSNRYLESKNRRILGYFFKTLGIKLTLKMIGLRYEK